MRAQLDYLIKAQNEHLSIGVLPFAAGAHFGLQGAFHIMEFRSADDESVLFLENAMDTPLRREADQIARYRERFDAMYERSVRDARAATLIRRIAKDLS